MLWFLIIALAVIGLMMQFSASVILELSAGTNPYWGVARPLLIMAVGFAAMIFISRLPVGFFEKFALTVIFPLAIAGQLAVFTSLGRGQGGNRNWVYIPGINQVLQPSEFLKVAFILLLVTVFSSGRCRIDSLGDLFKWVGLPFIVIVATVMAGHDMGTLLIFVSILLCVLLIAGISLRWLGIGIGLLSVAAVGAAQQVI
ncbi:MAG: FtsW/RodA/SpoVE family cell cycle protein, partial [Varibaculum cambriense]|nr:FtsW/RodA/SpoVE family cell cycle protein [Varibaculum cambriense]